VYRTSEDGHIASCKCAQLQTCRQQVSARSAKVAAFAWCSGAQMPCAHQYSTARRSRDGHSSTKSCKRAYTEVLRSCLGGRSSWKKCDHICTEQQQSAYNCRNCQCDRFVHRDAHMVVSCRMAAYSLVCRPGSFLLSCLRSPSTASSRKGSA
jgi:hypothetical protein